MKSVEHAKYVSFLNSHKKLVGLTDWDIILIKEIGDLSDLAQVEPNLYEKKLTITLSNDFIELNHSRKKNVLIHELIHGRIEVFNLRKATVLEELEEDLANDLTRGFERHNAFKW